MLRSDAGYAQRISSGTPEAPGEFLRQYLGRPDTYAPNFPLHRHACSNPNKNPLRGERSAEATPAVGPSATVVVQCLPPRLANQGPLPQPHLVDHTTTLLWIDTCRTDFPPAHRPLALCKHSLLSGTMHKILVSRIVASRATDSWAQGSQLEKEKSVGGNHGKYAYKFRRSLWRSCIHTPSILSNSSKLPKSRALLTKGQGP